MTGRRVVLRRLVNGLTALSALLCAAVCVLWVRSCFLLDVVDGGRVDDPPTSGAFVQAYSNRGAISVRRLDVAVRGAAPPGYRVEEGLRVDLQSRVRWRTRDAEPWPSARYRYLLGFGGYDATYLRRPRRDVSQTERDHGVTFPHWVPVLVAAVPPALWLRRRRASRHAGLCPDCGYDLRATPDRCPECGTAVSN